eukprot:3999776-Prymnesium_polylepis.1
MSANPGYTPGSMLRMLRACTPTVPLAEWGQGGATDFNPALATKAVAFCDAPAPHISMLSRSHPAK